MEHQEKNIIIRYFEGTCTEVEIQQVKTWMEVSAENKRLFQNYERILVETQKLAPKFHTVDVEQELEKFLSQIQTESSDDEMFEQNNRPLWLSSWVKFAASVIVIIGLGISSYFLFNKRTAEGLFTEITVPYGSKTQISLPDGTIVWLNAGSRLRYEKNFNKETRDVQIEGEGYFVVAKDPSRPFVVEASSLSIRAVGTEFNVKCYPGEGTVETTLIEGAVKVSEKKELNNLPKEVMLKPNQKLTFIKKTGKLFLSDELKLAVDSAVISEDRDETIAKERKEQVIVKTIDPLPVISWKEDKLILTGERFEEVKVKLERWYDVNIEISDPAVLDLQFKGTFQKESVGQALDALRLAAPFNYKIDKKHITIIK